MPCVFVSCVQCGRQCGGECWECVLICMGSGLYVVGGCSVKCTCCVEHGRYGLSCLYAETVESMSSASWVCMVCMVCMVQACIWSV